MHPERGRLDPATGPAPRGTQRAHRMVRAFVLFTGAVDILPAEPEPVVELISRGDLAWTAGAPVFP